MGFRFVQFPAPKDYNWRDSKDDALSGVVWYSAASAAEEKDRCIGRPDSPFFYAGRVAQDAMLASASRQYPVMALSPGMGCSASQMAWPQGLGVSQRHHTVISDMLADPVSTPP